MENLRLMLQTPVFLICRLFGAFVVFMFCYDQFDKPTVSQDEKDPWKFVAPRNLTPRRQYLVGFFVYCGVLLLIFLALSLVGPDKILQIAKSSGVSTPELDAALKDFSTFPIVVAFVIIGLNPSLHLPKSLDFEIFIRGLAHRIAYIPKNMDLIFNYMRFSDFDWPQVKIDDAWNAIGLRRPLLDAPDCGSIRSLLDRTVPLYVKALNLASDGEIENGREVMEDLRVDLFRQYRDRIQDVEVGVQAVCSRLFELNGLSPSERRRSILSAQKELSKSLEFLYVIFACAIAGKGMDRISRRLSALGFRSNFEPNEGVPWDPSLKSLGAAALVLATGWLIAANTLGHATENSGIPTEPGQVLWLLFIIIIVHLAATVQALHLRARLVGLDEYFSETGSPLAIAIIKLFLSCFVISLGFYLLLNSGQLIFGLADTGGPVTGPAIPKQSSAELIWDYFKIYAIWSFVPACCGVMIAGAIERADEARLRRLILGSVQGGIMAGVALLSLKLTSGSQAPFAYCVFTVVLYGGLGLILGYMLPAALRRHWAALERRLPDKIAILRTSVLQYFYNIQQFTEWLNVSNEGLNRRRPLDILSEETGLQQLTSLVTETRTKVGVAGLTVR
jgi:hypothetical protein